MNDTKVDAIVIFKLVMLSLFSLSLLVGFIFGICALHSKYNVWSSSLEGQAELNKANWNRQIAVKEAEAKRDAAKMLAIAEVERAKGVAQANQIIGDSLHNNQDYLRYLWIQNLHNENNQVIYVPTEANLPILEANRLKK